MNIKWSVKAFIRGGHSTIDTPLIEKVMVLQQHSRLHIRHIELLKRVQIEEKYIYSKNPIGEIEKLVQI